MNLMIVPGMFVCSSFLINVCMFILLKALLISNATVIVRAGDHSLAIRRSCPAFVQESSCLMFESLRQPLSLVYRSLAGKPVSGV